MIKAVEIIDMQKTPLTKLIEVLYSIVCNKSTIKCKRMPNGVVSKH